MSEKLSPQEYLRQEQIDIDKDDYEAPDDTIKRIFDKADREFGEGITVDVERARKSGQLPTVEKTLEDFDRRADAIKLADAEEQGHKLHQETQELLGTIRHLYADIKLRTLNLPGTPEFVEQSQRAANAWASVQIHFRSYELSHLTEDKLVEAMRQGFDTLVEVEHWATNQSPAKPKTNEPGS